MGAFPLPGILPVPGILPGTFINNLILHFYRALRQDLSPLLAHIIATSIIFYKYTFPVIF